MYIYIYPRGRRFTGNSCPKGVYIYEVGVGLGWGGDGNVPWTCTHGRCYATSCSLHLHTWSVLRKSWDGVGLGWGGVGMVTFLALAHMVGATQHHVPCTCTHGRCYATSCSLHLHTWSVLRKSWDGVGWEKTFVASVRKTQSCADER